MQKNIQFGAGIRQKSENRDVDGEAAACRQRTRNSWPRPLAFHLSAVQMIEAQKFWEDCAQSTAAAEVPERMADALAQFQACLSGIQHYHHHPFRRALPDVPPLCQIGTMQVRDYCATGTSDRRQPYFLVPSLINRCDILDLYEGNSLVRRLQSAGHGALLVDWQTPGTEERSFDVGDYIVQRLQPAFEAAVDKYGGPMPIVGYCMGGVMALALALRNPDRVSGFAALATPWDFTHFQSMMRPADSIDTAILLEPVLQAFNELPVDMLQVMFAGLDLTLTGRKFRRFATMDPASAAARNFVAMEDWANDGVPLSAPAARECFADWFNRNQPVLGEWKVDGQVVRPQNWAKPSLVVAPGRDRIVPPASSLPLAEQLPNADILTPNSGHVAMVAGRDAERQLWEPLINWLQHH